MSRPLVVDAFPFNNELDLLECRLVELFDAVDWFVLVEATRDHQDHPKPLWFAEHRERFAPWADKIVHVAIPDGGMPSIGDDDDPWAREHAQREWIGTGLARIPYDDDTVILQSDVDEIPRDHEFLRDELFLPFLAVSPVASLDEAITEANSLPYGLTAGIFSEDEEDVARFMDEVEAGVVYANRAAGATTGAWPGVQSFGGWKESGLSGRHALGPHYVQQFMREQSRTLPR